MRVVILHQKFNELSGKREGYEAVAVVNADPSNPAAQGGVNGALEYAWMRSQNIYGSWSKGEFHESGEENHDYSPNVIVLASLKVIDGRQIGLRSSMMGDVFMIDGDIYEAKMMGFEKIGKIEVLERVEA